MLSGDETGWLLGDYILSQIEPGRRQRSHRGGQHRGVVAHAGRHRRGPRRAARRDTDRVQVAGACRRRSAPAARWSTPTRRRSATASIPPRSATRTASARPCWPAIWLPRCAAQGRTVLDALDDLARRHGVHTTTAVSRRVADADEAQAVMARLRATPPDRLAGFEVTVTDLLHAPRSAADRRADLVRRRRRQLGPDRGASVGHRAEGQVLHRGSLRANIGDLEAARASPRHARFRTKLVSVAQRF